MVIGWRPIPVAAVRVRLRRGDAFRLPNHVVGVARRANVESVVEGFERAFASDGADVADLVIAYGEIALLFGAETTPAGPGFCIQRTAATNPYQFLPVTVSAFCPIWGYFTRMRFFETLTWRPERNRPHLQSNSGRAPTAGDGPSQRGLAGEPPRASLNSRSGNIFNGLLLVPVNEKIPAFSSI